MLRTIKFFPLERRSRLVIGAVLLFSVSVLLHYPVRGQCPLWVVDGEWSMDQDGTQIFLCVRQTGKDYDLIVGEAGHLVDRDILFGIFGSSKRGVLGTVDGTIKGDSFNVEIYWPDGLTGVYQGTVRPTGRVEGITYDKKRRSIRANWHSTTLMRCSHLKDPAAPIKPIGALKTKPAPLPERRVIRSTGRAPTEGGTLSAVPKLIAFNKPKQTPGTRTLTWDAGPDHPYAELWVKVDDGDETFVVELSKGIREVTVEPGKTYLYILTDSGERLATATVTSR